MAGWIDTQKFDKGDKAILSDQVTLGQYCSLYTDAATYDIQHHNDNNIVTYDILW